MRGINGLAVDPNLQFLAFDEVGDLEGQGRGGARRGQIFGQAKGVGTLGVGVVTGQGDLVVLVSPGGGVPLGVPRPERVVEITPITSRHAAIVLQFRQMMQRRGPHVGRAGIAWRRHARPVILPIVGRHAVGAVGVEIFCRLG